MAELKWLVNSGNYYYFGDAPAHVTGVSLDKSSISLTEVGQTEQLTATVIPYDAVNKKVIWSSSNTSIATVTQTGLVTCITPGECTITVTSVDTGISTTCSVINYKDVYVDFLLIAGGGGAGLMCYYCGNGGGGGGGYIYKTNYYLEGGDYPVVIGNGGAGTSSKSYGCNGGNSSFNNLIAYGGGAGGGPGCPGGSGGGGNGSFSTRDNTCGGAGCTGQGYRGGSGGYYTCCGGGGGGGAGGLGSSPVTNKSGQTVTECGGKGGDGKTLNTYGIDFSFSGGGGGSGWNRGGCPGCGGGGAGGNGQNAESIGYPCGKGCDGTSYGGGGGGLGGSGYQGILLVWYPSNCGYGLSGGCKFECNGYCVHCFTSNDTLTVE